MNRIAFFHVLYMCTNFQQSSGNNAKMQVLISNLKIETLF